MNLRPDNEFLEAIGAVLIVMGIAFIYWPLALIVLGATLIAAAVVYDYRS